MIELKTSALLGGATLIGAIIGGADEHDCTTLQRFATELGLAFQLQDDLLDSYGDERLGKAIGGDILEGKQTFLKIMAMSRADDVDRHTLRTLHRNKEVSDSIKILTIKDIYDSLDVVRTTEQQIYTRFERAISLLDNLSVDPARVEQLKEYARSLMNREK